MDSVSRMIRQLKKGRKNRLLTYKQEKIAAGWVIHRTHTQEPTRTIDLKEFIQSAFNICVSNVWITRFKLRQHLSGRFPSRAMCHEADKGIVELGANFIQQIRDLHKRDEQIVVMDKCKFYSDPRYIRHLAAKGRYNRIVFAIFIVIVADLAKKEPTMEQLRSFIQC
jgi:hypothetical protein